MNTRQIVVWMIRTHTVIGLLGIALAVGTLCACGGDRSGGTSPTKPAGASQMPTSSSLPSVKGHGNGHLPAGFPTPPGAVKGPVSQVGGTTAAQLTVSNGTKAYHFWLKRLPAEGYTISRKSKVYYKGTTASITFAGHGYKRGDIGINDKTANIVLVKK